MKLQELIDAGELEGFTPGLPPTAGDPLGGTDIDVAAAEGTRCEPCGTWREYRPFVREAEAIRFSLGDYRAFAVCPRCDEAVEF